MPTYEYICENCNYKFEKFQMISAGALKKCPQCGKLKLRRLIGTGAGIIFKGDGFYETDYRSDSYRKAKEGEKKVETEKKPAIESKPKTAPKANTSAKKESAKKTGS